MDLKRLSMILSQVCILSPEDRIVAGVSGGPDSVAMLHALFELGFRPLIAHLDHNLRPKSGEEAAFVAGIAGDLGLQYRNESILVKEYAETQKLSVEQAARICRYTFLFKTAREYQARGVLVAHNADDQVETIMMHILRGSGTGGLLGMAARTIPNEWDENIALLRPFLGVWREEILEYCRFHRLDFVQDESNLDPAYFRNRLRNELLPLLETYQPTVRKNLLQMSSILREDYRVVQDSVRSAWRECLVRQSADHLGLLRKCFIKQPRGIQRELVRQGIGGLMGDLQDVDFQVVERALFFADNPSVDNVIEMTAGIRLFWEEDQLILARIGTTIPNKWPQCFDFIPRVMEVPGQFELKNGMHLSADILNSADLPQELDKSKAYLDVDSIQLPLVIRTRKNGDRFEPLGMPGKEVKLSDFMINEKIPRRARSGWPLVTSGERIVWIAGMRQAHFPAIKPGTERVVKLSLQTN